MRIWLTRRLDVAVAAGAVDDGRVFLGDLDALGLTEVGQGGAFEAHADFLADHLATGQNGDVLKHGFTAVAEAGGLDRADLDDAANVVDHQRSQRLAVNVFGDDHQWPA